MNRQTDHSNNNNNKQTSSDYLQFKLSDLIDPKKAYLFDNIYAKLEPNSNKLNLIYLQQQQQQQQHQKNHKSLKHVPDTYFQLASKLLKNNNNSNNNINNNSSNLIMNDFYLLASKQHISNYCKLLLCLLFTFVFVSCQY